MDKNDIKILKEFNNVAKKIRKDATYIISKNKAIGVVLDSDTPSVSMVKFNETQSDDIKEFMKTLDDKNIIVEGKVLNNLFPTAKSRDIQCYDNRIEFIHNDEHRIYELNSNKDKYMKIMKSYKEYKKYYNKNNEKHDITDFAFDIFNNKSIKLLEINNIKFIISFKLLKGMSKKTESVTISYDNIIDNIYLVSLEISSSLEKIRNQYTIINF